MLGISGVGYALSICTLTAKSPFVDDRPCTSGRITSGGRRVPKLRNGVRPREWDARPHAARGRGHGSAEAVQQPGMLRKRECSCCRHWTLRQLGKLSSGKRPCQVACCVLPHSKQSRHCPRTATETDVRTVSGSSRAGGHRGGWIACAPRRIVPCALFPCRSPKPMQRCKRTRQTGAIASQFRSALPCLMFF